MKAAGRGAMLEEHGHDVIMLTKRHASDEQLIQEPTLAFPFKYLSELPPLPKIPRPLALVKASKRKHYLALCEVLLSQTPTESSRRSVEFLVSWVEIIICYLLM